MTQPETTIIIGGGQAGLATSYYLTQQGTPHVILEQAPYVGSAWRDGRWDSFTLVSPNWAFALPGATYDGSEPDAYMAVPEIAARFDKYAASLHPTIHYGVRVTSLTATGPGHPFHVQTDGGALQAASVVVAAGLYQRAKRPAWADALRGVEQLHSGEYRNPGRLSPGGVLVVGSSQSGAQIAAELAQSGRQVYLALGTAGRAPRRYRGKDIFAWLMETGFMDRSRDILPTPRAKFSGNPHVSGQHGGQTLNFHEFAREGMVLLGRVEGGAGRTIACAPNRNETLVKIDDFEQNLVKMIDAYIQQHALDAPAETLPSLRDGYAGDEITSVDLEARGIRSIVWAAGYGFDFNWVHLPIFAADGYPVQTNGATEWPGLYFVGLPWLTKYRSVLLCGVGDDAAGVAAAIAASSARHS